MDFASLTPLTGGWSGQTFLAEVAGGRQVVRIYPPGSTGARGELGAEVDAALLQLMQGLLPVPEVVEVRRAVPEADQPALLVTGFLPGVRGDLVLPDLDAVGRGRLGRAVGEVAATLGGIPMLRQGPFVDADLRIGSCADIDDLTSFVESQRAALGHWSPAEHAGLLEVAYEAQALLDTVGRHCLVHSDLNPKNLLVDSDTLTVTGVLDWEFAHAGHPATDLGNVLRFDRDPAYADGVVTAYCERRGGDPDDLVRLARAADLLALVDLAGRRADNPVAQRAHDLLLGIARERDAGWTPPLGAA
ncbi:MAG: phosphotransferase [Actinomycetota bacterium]|nr:phosphotransferase [Actinomycetota bacterium]